MPEIAHPTNWAQLCFVLGFFPALFLLGIPAKWICRHTNLFLRTGEERASVYAPPPHDHVCDLTRSEVSQCADGSMRLQCSVSGCPFSILIAPAETHQLADPYHLQEMESYR